MAFIEVVTIELGAAIAKSILRLWVKDSTLGDNLSSSVVDLLKSRTSDVLAQRRGRRQFVTIGEKVAENLLPLFEIEGARLKGSSRTAVAHAVATAFDNSRFSSELLVKRNLEPTKLAKYILDAYPTATQHFDATEKALYERIIYESCTYIVDIASQLPAFNERTFAEILKREDQLLFRADQLLREVRQVRKQLNSLVDAGRFEIDYRRTIARNLDVLQLLGTDLSTANRRHRLSVAYITLSVEQKSELKSIFRNGNSDAVPIQEAEFHEASEHDISKDTVSVDRALASSHRLLIRGLAGSGKTTLLQWIAVRSASRSFEGYLSDWNDTIPFYIRLRHCVLSGLPRPEAFPELVAPAISGTMPKGWVHMALELGRAIVLIDGVDEVPSLRRQDVRAWLKELVETYPQSRFIVTSRPHAVEEGWMDHEEFHDAELQPMRLSDIYFFIDHWHKAVREELQEDEEKVELESLAERLKSELRQNRSLRSLATNPLLCAMICALNRERRQQLPTDRIELYEACCSLLLERRDKARSVDLTDFPVLNYRQKRFLLEDLAYWMIKNNWSEVALQSVDERFARKLVNMPSALRDVPSSSVRRLLVERTGIIREPAKDQIDFTHRTFQEFLAAQAASDETDTGVLVANAHSDQWREVIVLASGLASKKMREDLIKGLIERGDAEKECHYQLYLLAVSCLETSIEVEQQLRAEVDKRLKQLIPPKDMTEATAMAAAGELAVKHLAKRDYSASISAACVRCLALVGTEAALETLVGYVDDVRSDVSNELIRAWDSFDRETYAGRVLAQALRHKSNLHLDRLPSLEGIGYFSNLTSLSLSPSSHISDFSPLKGLTQLKSLNLSGCSYPKDLSSLVNLTQLTSLNLSGCSFNTLKPLASLTQLTSLDLSDCSVDNLSSLASLTHLRSLVMSGYASPLQIWKAGLSQLGSLTLSRCSDIHDLSRAGISQLTSLSLVDCAKLDDLTPLTSLRRLTSLKVSDSRELTNLGPLADLAQLTSLTLSNCELLGNLKPLASLKQLSSLSFSGCDKVRNLGPLAGLTQLTSLDLTNCYWLTDLGPLAGLIQLTSLDLTNCNLLTDLGPLAGLIQLTSLDLAGCSNIKDLGPLIGLKNLKELVLNRNAGKSALPQSFKKRVRVTIK